jgi:hypothetical protein
MPPLPSRWSLKLVSIVCPETLVRNWHYSLRNSPEERCFLFTAVRRPTQLSAYVPSAGDFAGWPRQNCWHIAYLRQQYHSSKCVIFEDKLLKILKCYNFLSATTTQLLSSGEFWKLPYDTIPVKSASAKVSFCTNKSKMPNFELWHSCRKWAIYIQGVTGGTDQTSGGCSLC